MMPSLIEKTAALFAMIVTGTDPYGMRCPDNQDKCKKNNLEEQSDLPIITFGAAIYAGENMDIKFPIL